ncbi:MAG: hypothetical protein JSS81_25650 [Acidobacteria bacterium]|nr:hypothetical protein [Acidobacteriota bacterium]
MKIAALVIGILLMIVSFIVAVVCLLLPSMTNNRVNFGEAMIGLVPAVIVGFLAFVVTVVAAIALIRGRNKTAAGQPE